MRVQFHGAAGEVTGSMHLVEAAGRRVLLDCGMIQGGREAEARNFEPFPFDPATLDALVVSHAHIDHIGRIPRLVRQGFRGPIFVQQAGADLLLMPDLNASNMLYKSFIYVGGGDCAGLVQGARVPVVITSRADSVASRIASVALAVLAMPTQDV